MNRKRKISGLLLAILALPLTAAVLMAQDGALEARLAYISDGAGGYEPWGAIGTGSGPGYPLKGVLLYCKSGSTTAICSPGSTGFDPASNQAITGTWSFSHSIAANGGIVTPAGQTIQVSDSASASSALFTSSFSNAGLNVTSNGGSAELNLNGNVLNGIYAGPAFGSATFIMGETQSAASGLSDSVAQDTIVTGIAAKTVRIGVGSGASTMRVTSSGIDVTGTISSGGTPGVSKTCGATITVTNGIITAC